MKRLLMKWVKTNELWAELLRREITTVEGEASAFSVWPQVFQRIPELRRFMRARELTLLKAMTIPEASRDFILGQIAENRLWQNYDIPSAEPAQKVEGETERPRKTLTQFLMDWKQPNAQGTKETKDVSESRFPRGKGEPPKNP